MKVAFEVPSAQAEKLRQEAERLGVPAEEPGALPAPHLMRYLIPKQLAGTYRECYCGRMTLKARVKAGRLVMDEPTDLPEGTEIELLPLDPGDWLDEDSRAALHKTLVDSEEDVKAGRLIDADSVLRELRSR
jgi:hypothetical protein